jgi:hypothetical protein
VASDRDEQKRLQALVACTLVSRSFASEFRQYLFEILTVRENTFTEDDLARRLCAHAQVLEERPEYQGMVKTVILVLAPTSNSIAQDTRFPMWLKGLNSVSKLIFAACDGSPLDFTRLPPDSRDAIIKLCMSSSTINLNFDKINNLPSGIFCNAPNLQYLTLGAVTMGAWFDEFTVEELELISSTKPGIHLSLHHAVIQVAQLTLQAIVPILVRVWKLSGEYHTTGDAMVTSMSMYGARRTLRESELTFSSE